MKRAIMHCAIYLLVSCSSTALAQDVRILNDTPDPMHFWIRSEGIPNRPWTYRLIGRRETKTILLTSPDHFRMVVLDSQGVEYRAEPAALRAMLKLDPNLTVFISSLVTGGPDQPAVRFEVVYSNGQMTELKTFKKRR